ncbi:MAG: cysteine desulfurase [Clostridiales bacterium]|nr:cysteine desulfurase [Clostridiales bacterium]
MFYFDYAANTPVDPAVIECFSEECTRHIANPNSSHFLGREAKGRMEQITKQIAGMLEVNMNEIIYTSGASEANNLAIKGLAHAQRQLGKHIISTSLEHSSVSGALTFLQSQGYEIDLLDVTSEGIIDIQHLQELLRKDTILVSICYVDSELGVQQPIEEIGKLLKEYPNCYFHTDATQAMGKIPVHFDTVDMMTFAPHKFYGLNSCGVLVKREHVILEPLIHGGASTTMYRSGTPDIAHAASIEKALEIALREMESRYAYVDRLKGDVIKTLSTYSKVRINSTKKSIPHIINLSVQGVKAPIFVKALEEEGICVSIKSACSVANTPSRPVYAVTRDRKNAMSSWRISLSHLTRQEELEHFKEAFDKCYNKLTFGP